MDKANYHLAWHLVERARVPVHLVAHRVTEPLASHPLVRVHPVSRPLGRHFLGGPLLAKAGRRLAGALTEADSRTRVIVNGGNCEWPGINWVHMVHQACVCVDQGAPLTFRLKNRLFRFLACRAEKRALQCSSLVIVNSERTRRDVTNGLGISPERVELVYLGTDEQQHGPVTPAERALARARLELGDTEVAVVFVGALGLDRRKGFDTLLAAVGRLRTLFPGLKVLAAGNGAIPYWQARIDAAGLAACVRLLGHIDNVPALLAAADLVVSPTRYEPYGLGVQEALCRGVPAIVSRAAGVAERYPLELARLLLNDAEDDAELAGRIASWLRRTEGPRPALERLASSLRGYSWRQMSERIMALVETHYGETKNLQHSTNPKIRDGLEKVRSWA